MHWHSSISRVVYASRRGEDNSCNGLQRTVKMQDAVRIRTLTLKEKLDGDDELRESPVTPR